MLALDTLFGRMETQEVEGDLISKCLLSEWRLALLGLVVVDFDEVAEAVMEVYLMLQYLVEWQTRDCG